MDFGKNFSFVFDDPAWMLKVGIGGFFVLLINFTKGTTFGGLLGLVAGPILMGWFIEVIHRVAHNHPTPLTAWDDLGSLWTLGFGYGCIIFLYALPAIILLVIAFFSLKGNFQPGMTKAQFQGLPWGEIIIWIALASLWYLFTWLIHPALMGLYGARKSFGAAFAFGDIFGLIFKDFGAYLLAGCAYFGALLLVGVCAALPLVGPILAAFAFPYQLAVTGHAFGRLAASGGYGASGVSGKAQASPSAEGAMATPSTGPSGPAPTGKVEYIEEIEDITNIPKPPPKPFGDF